MDDESLVRGCIEKKKEYWDAFVERFERLIYWGIQRTLEKTFFAGRQDVLEDVFQDVFMRLLERDELDKLREARSLKKFLLVMACHMTIDKVRRLSASESKLAIQEDRNDQEPLLVLDSIADIRPDPLAVLEAGESRRLVKEALGDLPAKERACLELHYLSGRPHREIGLILGLPQDTVSTIIRRSREKLKALLLKRGIDEKNH